MIHRSAALALALSAAVAVGAEEGSASHPAGTPEGPAHEAAPAAHEPAAQAPGEATATANHKAENPAETPAIAIRPDVPHVQVAHDATAQEIASLLRLGRSKRESGDFDSAEIAYLQVLAEHATPEQDREAVLGLARTYRKKGDFTKASASYEKFAKEFPNDPELPAIYLELGRTLRALGAFKQAIGRFYAVLNTTLKLSDQGAEQYRQLVRTAQYEIAETYFQTGDYAQANRYFSRLKLLDLAPEDRARAHFKSVVALTLAGDDEKAVAGLRAFIEQNADDENVPEAQSLLSNCLRRLGRTQESLQVTLDLLKTESARTKKDPRRWQYWQRKTGNQLANDFYERGDVDTALRIYGSLAQLSPEAAWSLPVKYQMGLCFERLRRFDKARECYQTIVDNLKTAKGDTTVRPDLADLGEMAAWRLSQISWQLTTDQQLTAVFTNAPIFPPASAPAPARNVTSASDHDAHGNTTIASDAVR